MAYPIYTSAGSASAPSNTQAAYGRRVMANTASRNIRNRIRPKTRAREDDYRDFVKSLLGRPDVDVRDIESIHKAARRFAGFEEEKALTDPYARTQQRVAGEYTAAGRLGRAKMARLRAARLEESAPLRAKRAGEAAARKAYHAAVPGEERISGIVGGRRTEEGVELPELSLAEQRVGLAAQQRKRVAARERVLTERQERRAAVIAGRRAERGITVKPERQKGLERLATRGAELLESGQFTWETLPPAFKHALGQKEERPTPEQQAQRRILAGEEVGPEARRIGGTLAAEAPTKPLSPAAAETARILTKPEAERTPDERRYLKVKAPEAEPTEVKPPTVRTRALEEQYRRLETRHGDLSKIPVRDLQGLVTPTASDSPEEKQRKQAISHWLTIIRTRGAGTIAGMRDPALEEEAQDQLGRLDPELFETLYGITPEDFQTLRDARRRKQEAELEQTK